jgi:hypothetical protein
MVDQLQSMAVTAKPRLKTSGRIRPFVMADLPQIVDLYLKVFPQGHHYTRDRLLAHFKRVLLQNPWYNPASPSLVYEQDNGNVCGFLGVVARPMLLGGELIRVATSNHFMVDPSTRSTIAGLELLSSLFAGRHDLTIAESGDHSRRIWEALGGRTSFARSLFWTRVLRPARFALYHLRQRRLPLVLARMTVPICGAFDILATRLRHSPLHQVPQESGEEVSAKGLVACFSLFQKQGSLSPHYDECSLKWLLSLLAKKEMLGTLRSVLVRRGQNQVIGWYIYYLNPGGVSTVLHLDVAPGRFDQVFKHLCYHSWRQGSIALTGRLEPRFTKEVCDHHCLLHWRSWMLVHSRNPKILAAFESKDAILTALEGEWWISVEGEKPD